ncbi:MAG: Pycsar system effector family protein [Candidatus Hodarchaeota archaeon]
MSNQDQDQEKTSLEITEQIGYFKYSFEHAQKLVEFADSKASTLLTLHAVIVTIISAALFIDDIRLKIDSIIDSIIVFTIIAIILISTGLLINVIRPREAYNDESLFYYRKIAQYSDENEYFNSFNQLSPPNIAKALANQAFEVSKIATIKMRCIKRSLILLIIYLVLLVTGSAYILFT